MYNYLLKTIYLTITNNTCKLDAPFISQLEASVPIQLCIKRFYGCIGDLSNSILQFSLISSQLFRSVVQTISLPSDRPAHFKHF